MIQRPVTVAAATLLALVAAACSSAEARWQVADAWPFDLAAEPVRADHGMVVSTDAYASSVGVRVLRDGGNAIDAVVATCFALAVVNTEAGNIGGGGFMVVRFADGGAVALDFREKAPAAAHRDMYLDERGELRGASVLGHLAVGVPGSVAGLWAAHRRHGNLPWARLVDPAIALARGFAVTARQARSFAGAEAGLRSFPETERTFLPAGRPPRVGETFSQPDLAATLGRIRDHGRDGFYRGETAELIVAEMERGDGIITAGDLAGYQPAWRVPVRFSYRRHHVVSMAPVSSGGATLAAIAGILEGHRLADLEWHGARHVHLLAEAFKRAYSDRNAYLADPDFVDMPLRRMVSTAYAAERRATIDDRRATPSAEVGPGLGPPQRGRNTTHISVVDADGNAVAVTTTINSFFGSKVTVTGAGFVLNNEMDDFAAKPGSANQFGLVQGENNAIEPGKRMLSAMTPTIVSRPDGSLLLVTGTPGGGTIITNVFQNISNVIDFGMGVVTAVNAPRLHHQHLPDVIQFEPGCLSPAVIETLRGMGHELRERHDPSSTYPYIGDVQAIMVGPDGSLLGWSDPRRGGSAIGY